MTYNRREFLQTTSVAAVGMLGARPVMAHLNGRAVPVPPIQDPRLKELVQDALNIANEAKVSYSDVRLNHDRTRSFQSDGDIRENEALAVSVRVLFNGYWGFACSPIWSTEEVRRISMEAVAIAKANTRGKQRTVDLAKNPVVSDKHWDMPIRFDPFAISPDEIVDYLASLQLYMERTPGVSEASNSCSFTEQQKAFGSTAGSYCTQKLYSSNGVLGFRYVKDGRLSGGAIDLLTPAGVGWELYRDQPIRDAFQQELEEVIFDLSLPVKPVDVGRYTAVFDAQSVGSILHRTIGDATKLTRIMGYDANDSGTSYITDPIAMLGSLQIGGPLLNVSTNRNESGGSATVQWDDEGVVPVTTSLVTDGQLSGFSTMRESATWLKSSSVDTQPLVSSGSAYAGTSIDVPKTIYGNLHLVPGSSTDDFDTLIGSMSKGVAFRRMRSTIDFQCLNGFGQGKVYEIKDGRRVGLIANAGLLFKTPEFWKLITALGGPNSARRFNGVTSVPLVAKDLTVIDVLRKA